MRLEHIFVGKPIEADFNGKTITTGIYKEQVKGLVRVEKTNIVGDQQADLTVHGGINKAVYAYPIEHYQFWKKERSDLSFRPGVFGENLSISGVDEETICIGDRLRLGEVELSVTSPRMPCYKLGIKLKDPGFVRDFMKAEKNGFYFKVEQEGEIASGMQIEKVSTDGYGLKISEVIQLYGSRKNEKALLEKAINSPSIPADWRDYFEVRLRNLGK